MTDRHRGIALMAVVVVAALTISAWADVAVPSLPFKPAGPDQVLANYMKATLANKDLSAEQRAAVLKQLGSAQGDREAITESLITLYPEFSKALSALADEDLAKAMPVLKKLAASDNEYLAAHADFYLARAYIMDEKFEEALPLLASLAGPERSDKTLYAGEALFYEGITQNGLLRRSDALQSLMTFLRQNPEAPERLLVGASHLVEELKLTDEGSLFDVQGRMDFSRRRLSLKFTDKPVTQKEQTTIVTMLDKLIEEAEKKENQSGSGSGSGSGQGQGQGQGPPSGNNVPSSPAANSIAPEGQARFGALHRVARGTPGEGWGNLKKRDREAVIEAFKAKFPSRYRQAIEEYYKSLNKSENK